MVNAKVHTPIIVHMPIKYTFITSEVYTFKSLF